MPSWQSHLLTFISRKTFKEPAARQAFDEWETVRRVRRRVEDGKRWRAALPADVRREPTEIRGVAGEWLIPEGHSGNEVILYLHGGGYLFGSPASHRNLTMHLARTARRRVLALDYRLAPENPYPAALEDALAGYRALLEDEGITPERIAIGGDSAGGGLALATMLAAREAGLPLPGAAFLYSPWTDLAGTGDSLVRNEASDALISGKEVHRMSKLYFGGASPRDPFVSPLYGKFHGLPPTLIHVSDNEVLLDDALRLADRAREDGVEVDLRVRERLIHAWPVFVSFRLPEAFETVRETANFLEATRRAA
ncbi:MAG: alpha/beta hydrolase [Blastocatellia bacterium]|jgi:acetyl esterase/lipase